MPTTLTVKDVIKTELLRVCKDVTDRLMEKEAKKDKKRKFSREDVTQVEAFFKEMGLSLDQANRWMKIYAVLHDAPELKAGSILPLELFAVVLIESNSGNHNYPAGKPLIVTGKEGFLWNPSDGAISNWKFLPADNPRYATDDEVEQCIKDLTDIQWKKLHYHDLFRPVVDAVMNKEVTVEEMPASDHEEGNNEIRLKDGRTIIIAEAPDSD